LSQGTGIEQWLFTFDSATGQVSRVEKIDPVSGSAHELSESEYAAVDSYLAALGAEPHADPPSAFNTPAAQRAYLQGVVDCAALYRQYRLYR
jgi:hypothetical protein